MRMLRHLWVALVSCVLSAAAVVPAAVADPDPAKNKQAVSRTLQCDDGQTLAATFAGDGSNFNVTIDQRVFVYKWIFIDRPPVGGEVGPNDTINDRGLSGFEDKDLVTCRYTTPTGNSVTAIGFFTGQG
jgi:hypothetical protein